MVIARRLAQFFSLGAAIFGMSVGPMFIFVPGFRLGGWLYCFFSMVVFIDLFRIFWQEMRMQPKEECRIVVCLPTVWQGINFESASKIDSAPP